MSRIVFGVSGASGMPLASLVLKNLREVPGLETHVIVSKNSENVCGLEGAGEALNLKNLGFNSYEESDFSAGPASGSWRSDGMIVCPCSMRSLAAIATGNGYNLIHRAADVTLKERRPLILAVRETPFNLIQLRNMVHAAEAGAVIMPFIPAFYAAHDTLPEMARNFAGRLLDILRIPNSLCLRWRDGG